MSMAKESLPPDRNISLDTVTSENVRILRTSRDTANKPFSNATESVNYVATVVYSDCSHSIREPEYCTAQRAWREPLRIAFPPLLKLVCTSPYFQGG
jgi:hypothetical protein